jgi:hypothetical protein
LITLPLDTTNNVVTVADSGGNLSQSNPASVKFDFGSPVTVNQYAITTSVTAGRYISSWTLQGSATGAFAGEQTIIDTQSGIVFAGSQRVPCGNNLNATYRYFKLNITAASPYGNLSKLELLGFPAAAGAPLKVTGKAFKPDLVWIKGRNATTNHATFDSVRGPQVDWTVNNEAGNIPEVVDTQGVSSFNSDGFSGGSLAKINTSGATYVDWLWKIGALSGVNVINYTGNGVARNIPHTLGVVPELIVIVSRASGGPSYTYHGYANAAPSSGYLAVGTTVAFTANATLWGAHTASDIALGTNAVVNGNGIAYTAYVFASVPGFSKFGSYIGNGNPDGPFVWCGFRPRWILIKEAAGTNAANGHWGIFDTARKTFNPLDMVLWSSGNYAEDIANRFIDALAPGFKLRSPGDIYTNENGGTYIYCAFAETPFKYARAR